MDIQTRKLKAIEYLVGLHDEEELQRIETAIAEVQQQKSIRQNVKPLTQKQLIERAKLSTSDYLSGRFKTQEQLQQESENW